MTANISIVDRVVERLKTQPIGDLITEEDLFEIVKEAIPRTFFTPRKNPSGLYNAPDLPPLIVEVMKDVLKTHVEKAVAEWVKEHEKETLEYWLKACDAGLVSTFQKLQDEKASAIAKVVLRPLVDQYNQTAQQLGRPAIFI